MSVAESDPDFGPSPRFNLEVLWRPDSKAFALTATLWKRGSYVAVVVEIENMVDGNDGSVTATRTVVLGFDRSDKAKILKSRIKFVTDKP